MWWLNEQNSYTCVLFPVPPNHIPLHVWATTTFTKFYSLSLPQHRFNTAYIYIATRLLLSLAYSVHVFRWSTLFASFCFVCSMIPVNDHLLCVVNSFKSSKFGRIYLIFLCWSVTVSRYFGIIAANIYYDHCLKILYWPK